MKYTYKQAEAILNALTPHLDDFLNAWAVLNAQDLDGLVVNKRLENRGSEGWVPGFVVARWRPAAEGELGLGENNLYEDVLSVLSVFGFIQYLHRAVPGKVSVAVHEWTDGSTVYVGGNEESVRRQLEHDLKEYWEAKPWHRGEEYPGIEGYFDYDDGEGEEESYVLHNDVEVK